MVDFGNEARASYGLEIEQFSSDVPDNLHGMSGYGHDAPWGQWHSDASGPIETELGPYKLAKPLAKKVVRDARRASGSSSPWQWRSASSRGRTATADGAGSHLHYEFNDPPDISDDELVEAWTIAYNTIIELTPIFAPFWCHDWANGFRQGTNYARSSQPNVRKWASPQTTRLSQDSVRSKVQNPSSPSRVYDAVTWNGARYSGKPLTLELRINDAHPAIAMAGMSMMKKLVVEAIKRGWSVKTEGNALSRNWNAAYAPSDGDGHNLFESLDDSGPIQFADDRGIPRLEGESFDSALDALEAIIESFSPSKDSWRDRVLNQWIGTAIEQNAAVAMNPRDNNHNLWALFQDDWMAP